MFQELTTVLIVVFVLSVFCCKFSFYLYSVVVSSLCLGFLFVFNFLSQFQREDKTNDVEEILGHHSHRAITTTRLLKLVCLMHIRLD